MDATTIYEDGTYLDHNPTWHEEHSAWKADQICRMLAKNGLTPKTVCEIGCGAGGILEHLADEFEKDARFSGYDISSQAYGLCKPRERANLHFHLGDLLEEEVGPFDVLLVIDVFEHVEDYFGFLRKVHPKGVHTVFHVPLDLSVQTILRASPIMRDRAAVGHIHNFSKDTVLASLTDTGFEIVDYFYTKDPINWSHPGWEATLLELPRRVCFPLSHDLTVRVFGGYSFWVLAK